MMSVPERQHSIPDTGAETTKPDSRLAFPSSPTAQGVGDGSWWPRTRDPAAELPALIAAGTDRLGMVARIALNADAWDTRPQWLGETVQGCCRVIGERPRRASGCARGDRGSLRPLPASCGQHDQTTYIYLTQARIVAPGVSPLPAAGMHWRGRLSEISGWSFGHLGGEPPTDAVEPPTAPAQDFSASN